MTRASGLIGGLVLGATAVLSACGTQTEPETPSSRDGAVRLQAEAVEDDKRCSDALGALYSSEVKEIFGTKTVSRTQLARWFDVRSDGAAPLSVYTKYEDMRQDEALVVCAAVVPSVAPPGPARDEDVPSDSVTIVLREDGRAEVDAVGPQKDITTEFDLLESSAGR